MESLRKFKAFPAQEKEKETCIGHTTLRQRCLFSWLANLTYQTIWQNSNYRKAGTRQIHRRLLYPSQHEEPAAR
ncbi:hypothetical protein DUNSADRAFT_18119 [Dunaliella salina]|uniref:Encoded protein n=1 Tax=Dunaliella salina TaxID=3046 RepID=A0ABQ7G0L3_DUNSA|nr:hypothetical protein DUNSADRAFT_18119 [Dunaliella salina]|eukprot:KAF5828146.1 hypothetical protein DUNSADRAFT_18119 [Dunaliella salina]